MDARHLDIRKNVTALTAAERQRFVSAVLALKESPTYDEFVQWHGDAMQAATVLPDEPDSPDYRNRAHRGPVFLPWHREFLRRFEVELQKLTPGVTIPYWDWAADSQLADPKSSVVWQEDFMGGDGHVHQGSQVDLGAFAADKGTWSIKIDPDGNGPALLRQLGRNAPTLPTPEDLQMAMEEDFYDTPPWNGSPFTIGFRNRLEGWVTQRGDPAVKLPGDQLHNRVHLFVGGTMLSMASPNDPVFFLNHCFVDKIWADWQRLHPPAEPEPGSPEGSHPVSYVPVSGGPPGHNCDDKMPPWNQRTPRDVLDHTKLGYRYDNEITVHPSGPDHVVVGGVTTGGTMRMRKRRGLAV